MNETLLDSQLDDKQNTPLRHAKVPIQVEVVPFLDISAKGVETATTPVNIFASQIDINEHIIPVPSDTMDCKVSTLRHRPHYQEPLQDFSNNIDNNNNSVKNSRNKQPNLLNYALFIGSHHRAVLEERALLCSFLRPKVYNENLGIFWPFQYNSNDVTNPLSLQPPSKLTELKSLQKWPTLNFSLGPCFGTSVIDSPSVASRIQEESTQGKLFITMFAMPNLSTNNSINSSNNVSRIEYDRTNIVRLPVVAKCNRIRDVGLWMDRKHIKKNQNIYNIADDAYVDAYVCVLLSRLVESRITPHFPLCYGSTLSHVERRRDSKNSELYQIIWMEYLGDCNLENVIKKEKNGEVWWSLIFQYFAAMIAARKAFGFVHNDAHSKNAVVKEVPYDTVLYYRDSEGKEYAVKTFGKLVVIIDCGRAYVRSGNGDRIACSLFANDPFFENLSPDSQNVDIVRFCLSIEDLAPVISDENQRILIRSFFSAVCTTTTNQDLILELSTTNPDDNDKLDTILEIHTRTICNKGDPYSYLPLFYQFFKTTNVPQNIIPYELSL